MSFKKLGFFSSAMLVMGSMIGSGIFKKVVPMSGGLQSPSLVLLAWLVAGLISLGGALAYAELASLSPGTGGLVYYLRRAYGPFWSFLFGWTNLVIIQTASIASIAYVFAESLSELLRVDNPTTVRLIAILTILFLTTINVWGVVIGAIFENVFTLLKVAGLLMVLASVGFISAHSNLMQTPTAYPFSSNLELFGAFSAALISAFWAYDGWNNISFIGGEVENPKRNLPRAIILGVFGVMILYISVNAVYLHFAPVGEVAANLGHSSGVFAILLFEKLLGPVGAGALSLLLLISTLGSTNASVLTSARISQSMADQKLFFSPFAKVHSKYGTPANSLWLQGVWASGLILLGNFDQLTDLLIFAAFLFYGLGALSLFRIRALEVEAASSSYRVQNWIPIAFAIFCATLIVTNILHNPEGSAIGLAIVASGIPFYFYFSRKITAAKSR